MPPRIPGITERAHEYARQLLKIEDIFVDIKIAAPNRERSEKRSTGAQNWHYLLATYHIHCQFMLYLEFTERKATHDTIYNTKEGRL